MCHMLSAQHLTYAKTCFVLSLIACLELAKGISRKPPVTALVPISLIFLVRIHERMLAGYQLVNKHEKRYFQLESETFFGSTE